MKKKKLYFEPIFFGLLSLMAMIVAIFVPFMEAFKTNNPYLDIKGAMTVKSAFNFIFGGSTYGDIVLGVGHSTINYPLGAIEVNFCLYPLIGYCLLLSAFPLGIAAFIFSIEGKKITTLIFYGLALVLLITSGILILLSKEQIASAYFGNSFADINELIKATNLQIGKGFTICAISSFAGAALTIPSFLSTPIMD